MTIMTDEQMQEALELAETYVRYDEFDGGETMNALATISRALITASEQLAEANKLLAAEQAKVKALQPYKDAYDAGWSIEVTESTDSNDPYGLGSERIINVEGVQNINTYETVRVCKVISPESTAEMVKGVGDGEKD